MRARDESFWFALGISLAIHLLVVWVAVAAYIVDVWRRGGPWREDGVSVGSVYVEWDPLRGEKMGERAGTGAAINWSGGPEPQRAREGSQDQAALSLDDVGLGDVGDWPAKSRIPGDGGGGGEALRLVAHDGPPTRFGVSNAADSVTATPRLPQRRPGDAGHPVQAADPYPHAESESDPFAKRGSLEIRRGRVEARFGRKVKTTRPRFDVAGLLDVPTRQYPTAQFSVSADETGKVTSVRVLKSSGSTAIDHPVVIAMYDWWIEPPTDQDGRPIPDVMIWTIHFR